MGDKFLVIKTGQAYWKCTRTQAKDQRIWWKWRSSMKPQRRPAYHVSFI